MLSPRNKSLVCNRFFLLNLINITNVVYRAIGVNTYVQRGKRINDFFLNHYIIQVLLYKNPGLETQISSLDWIRSQQIPYTPNIQKKLNFRYSFFPTLKTVRMLLLCRAVNISSSITCVFSSPKYTIIFQKANRLIHTQFF